MRSTSPGMPQPVADAEEIKPPMVALLGGGYNPPTMAYFKMIEAVLKLPELYQVWLLPYHERAFGKNHLALPEHRLKMAQLLADLFGKRVSLCREEIDHEGPSYAVETTSRLVARYPGTVFDWIIGSDLVSELNRWKDFERLTQLTRFVVVLRPGSEADEMPPYVRTMCRIPLLDDLSSTRVRECIRAGQSFDQMVPEPVHDYIRFQGLYRS